MRREQEVQYLNKIEKQHTKVDGPGTSLNRYELKKVDWDLSWQKYGIEHLFFFSIVLI